MRWLQIGTHEWEKFVKPKNLINILKNNNLRLANIDGMNFNIFRDEWNISNDTSVNYITKFIKN
jgi:2-polyprenyl-6-hydroxyphenyl methylase/3-demethylubiquinone-9 3-methyltransferase